MKKKTRPDQLQGLTHRIETNAGRLFVTVNFKLKKTFEIFLRVGKHGGDLGPYVGAIARLVTLCLRYSIPVSEIVKQLETAGQQQMPPTVPDAVSVVLKRVSEGDKSEKNQEKRKL